MYVYKGAEPLDQPVKTNRYIPISDEEAAAKFAYFRNAEEQINGGPRRPVTCGTISGYRRHLADKETPCQRCRKAHNDYHRKYRARRAKTGALCGTMVGWRQHVKDGTPKCRKCKDAYNEYHAQWRAQKAAGGMIANRKTPRPPTRRVMSTEIPEPRNKIRGTRTNKNGPGCAANTIPGPDH